MRAARTTALHLRRWGKRSCRFCRYFGIKVSGTAGSDLSPSRMWRSRRSNLRIRMRLAHILCAERHARNASVVCLVGQNRMSGSYMVRLDRCAAIPRSIRDHYAITICKVSCMEPLTSCGWRGITTSCGVVRAVWIGGAHLVSTLSWRFPRPF